MAKQIKQALVAALVVFVVAVTAGAGVGSLSVFAMGTASTMTIMADVLGVLLPNTSSIPAVHADRSVSYTHLTLPTKRIV